MPFGEGGLALAWLESKRYASEDTDVLMMVILVVLMSVCVSVNNGSYVQGSHASLKVLEST